MNNIIKKFTFKGDKKGPSLLFLGGIHGNETAGIFALQKLIQEINEGIITIKKGSLTILPVCNEQAYKKDVRQIDENLNRVIKIHKNPATYEQKLANEITPLIQENDILLDLHSTHEKGDVPFLFCDHPTPNNQKLIDVIKVDYVLEGWPDIYKGQTEIEDFSTERVANDYHKSGTTLECGYHKEEEAKNIAYNAVIDTLKVFDLIEGEKPISHPKKHILMKGFIIKKEAGSLLKNYKHLDKITKGEKIAQYENGEILTAEENGYILLPNHTATIGSEWYYFGVDKL